MGINPSKGIYDEVDRFRYRSNWGCFVLALIILVGIAAGVYWLLVKKS